MTIHADLVARLRDGLNLLRARVDNNETHLWTCNGDDDGSPCDCGAIRRRDLVDQLLDALAALPPPADPPALVALREAWEAGFRLAVHYGDNAHHWEGQQRETQWKAFLLSQQLRSLPAAPPVTDTPQGWTPEYIASALARAYPPQIQEGDVIEFAYGDDPPMFQRLQHPAAVEDWNGKLRNRVRGIYRRIYPKPAAPPQEDQ